MSKPYWVASGSVRGSCSHRHKSEATAQRCAGRDMRDCVGLGGGAYSDRSAVEIEVAL